MAPFNIDELTGMSTDPAHLFMQLYDLLPESCFADRSVVEWLDRPEFGDQVARIEIDIADHGRADPERLRRIVRSTGHQAVFTLLHGIDQALMAVNPFAGFIEQKGLVPIAARYARSGLFNDPEVQPGALLPRCTFPGVPIGHDHKPEHFGVHYVPPGPLLDKVDYALLAAKFDPYFRREDPVPVGCAPFLGGYHELGFVFDRSRTPASYRLRPVDEGRAAFDRIPAIIERMDKLGVRIGVVPEGCLSEELLTAWKTVAENTAGMWKPLKWILVGSGSTNGDDPPANRAVLIDRTSGRTIMTHDKMERFTFDADQARNWGVPDPPPGRIVEGIRTGLNLAVRESSLGRLIMLICEDLGTRIGWDREALAFGTSHALVPIFSKPIGARSWETLEGSTVVAKLGMWVVVSNSMVVQPRPEDPPGNTWAVLGPGDPTRQRYDTFVRSGRAASVADVGLLRTEPEPTPPTIEVGRVDPAWLPRQPAS